MSPPRPPRQPSRARIGLGVLLVVGCALLPGCLLGSPAAAVSGEPYGMVIDDVKAMAGRNGPIWAGAPVFAFFDLPVAFALDTGFLPIALVVWAVKAISGGGDEDADEEEPETRSERRERARAEVAGEGKTEAAGEGKPETATQDGAEQPD